MIKALIFDFDGLILDTETPRYTVWAECYQKYQCKLSIFEYGLAVGSDDHIFDLYQNLEHKYSGKVDWDRINPDRKRRYHEILLQESILPGVEKYLQRGRELGLKIGLASSSSREWVTYHLSRFGLLGYFDCITTIDDTGTAKPDPALFNLTLSRLAILPSEAIVFEDSPNGCKAAKESGIFCVIVPNRITQQLQFDAPDLMIGSMKEILLEEIIKKAERNILLS